jgi:hypothetical protein
VIKPCAQSGTLPTSPTQAPAPAHCGLDQPTQTSHRGRGKSTLNSDATCLTIVDTLRSFTRGGSGSFTFWLQGLWLDVTLVPYKLWADESSFLSEEASYRTPPFNIASPIEIFAPLHDPASGRVLARGAGPHQLFMDGRTVERTLP